MKKWKLLIICLLCTALLSGAAAAEGTEPDNFEPVSIREFCKLGDGTEEAEITACVIDCEEGPKPLEMTPGGIKRIRRMALSGMVTGLRTELSVTGGTTVYSFIDAQGNYLGSIETYVYVPETGEEREPELLVVGRDGMYSFTVPEDEKPVLEPMSLAGIAVDRENGVYRVRIPDGEKVDDGGFFTAELYAADTYPLDSVYALQAGDRVLVAGSVWTVDSLLEEQDGRRELRVREDMDGYIVFEKETDTLCTALVNDWKPSTLLGTEKVMLPLPDKFTFAWLGPDEDSSRYYDQEAFVALLRSGETAGQLTQYNTSLRFSGGMVDLIVHSDYPEGPEETAQAPAPGGTGSSGTSSADAPAILAPAAFTSGFNTAMNLLAEEFTDVLGEDGAKEIRDSYLLSQTDPVGNFIYKGNGDWTLEAGFVFADENSASDNAPAVAASLTIRNAVPATTAYLARYALEMMISYEFRGEVSEDELRNWFDTAEDPGNVFTLPGYTLNVMKNDELVQYSILPPADRNPLLNGIQP